MDKVLWVKFGWSDLYQGGHVDGNFAWLNTEGGDGHEAFNFLPAPNGKYYCYVPPHGKSQASPSSIDPHGWTVICLAKFPHQKGVRVVGWYENATLMGKEIPRPEYKENRGFRKGNRGEKFCYSIESSEAYFVLPEHRRAFSHGSIKQAKFSYLRGPDKGIAQSEAKEEVFQILKAELARLKPLVVRQPNPEKAVDPLEDNTDPMGQFGTPEHRKAVEMEAERVATQELEKMGYNVVRRSDEKIGYDLQADSRTGKPSLFVEVKGTSGTARRFFMTPNEFSFRKTSGWRLAMVTNTLDDPELVILKNREVEEMFALQPMVWIGKEVKDQ